jgi:hypothetical protein
MTCQAATNASAANLSGSPTSGKKSKLVTAKHIPKYSLVFAVVTVLG